MEEPNPYQSPKDAGEGVVVARHAVQLGGVFGQAWGLYTRNFTLIAAAIIVIWLPLNLLSSYLSYVVLGPDDIFGVLLLIAVLDAFFGIIAEAWILAIGLAAMTGGTATLSGTLIRSLRAYFRMFLTRLLCELFTLVCLLFCVVPGIYVGIRMVLAESVVMAEGVSGVAAIRRSFELTRGYFWFVFLIGLVFIGFGVVVSFLTTRGLACPRLGHLDLRCRHQFGARSDDRVFQPLFPLRLRPAAGAPAGRGGEGRRWENPRGSHGPGGARCGPR